MRWLVADSVANEEAFFCGHLDSYSHYLAQAGEAVEIHSLSNPEMRGRTFFINDVVFALDYYAEAWKWGGSDRSIRIAQVAAICSPMPWDVRKPDGSPAYDLILSSLPWMVSEARAKGCRAEYMPLAFDARARVCGMGVTRDIPLLFCGTRGGNHQKREAWLKELADVVTIAPPTFGREYFKVLARSCAVLQIHAEWSRGTRNAMRIFEAAGMGCGALTDGAQPEGWDGWPLPGYYMEGPSDVRRFLRHMKDPSVFDVADCDTSDTLVEHTYVNRIPRIIELAREIGGF